MISIWEKVVSKEVDFGLKAWHMTSIAEVLDDYPEVEAYGIFGSRARGDHRRNSDIDLVLFGSGISYSTFVRIDDRLELLAMAFQFDVVRFEHLGDSRLRDRIASEWRSLTVKKQEANRRCRLDIK
jgi:predicted nucleotidyltransferase